MVNKIKLYKNFNIRNIHKNSIILIGNFDGVHLGHQKLFKLAKKYKRKFSLKIGVLTFEPMPKMYFNKNFNGSWNFGPNLKDNMKVLKLVNFSKKILSSKSKIFKEKQKYYESNHLSLNSSKTLKKLKWKTLLRAKEAIQMTLEWYSFYYKNRKFNKDKIIKFSINQIKEYNKITLKRKI